MSRFQTLHPNGEEDIQRVLDQTIQNKNVLATLFCQLSQPNLKQHRLPATSQRSRPCSAAGPHQGSSAGTDRLPDPDCQDSLLNPIWPVTWKMKARRGVARHFISWPRRDPHTGEWRVPRRRSLRPDSSPRSDVNANDTSAVANM